MASIVSLDDIEEVPHANLFPDEEPKTIRLELTAGKEVPAHSHPGRDIVFTVLAGAIELHLDEDVHTLRAEDVARFEGERDISPVAINDTTALIVLSERT